MLYSLLKFPAKIALYFYCRKVIINNKELLNCKGPVLIAANHPNSFLDAIILASIFKQPIYALARGDVFANNFFNKILRSLNMLPVYRLSEGAENLGHNYTTFNDCNGIFKKNGLVLMFSEGRCINEWHLRPLKKGTARLAITAWQRGIELKVLPLGINYSSFRFFGKNVILNFGEFIERKNVVEDLSGGKAIPAFNLQLREQLKRLVIEIEPGDKQKIKKAFFIQQPLLKKIFLFLPAVIGAVTHAPLYYPIIFSIRNRANDHYDSIVVGLLFLLYPIYLIAITLIVFFAAKSFYAFLLLAILPFTAWSLLQLKRQTH